VVAGVWGPVGVVDVSFAVGEVSLGQGKGSKQDRMTEGTYDGERREKWQKLTSNLLGMVQTALLSSRAR